MTGNLTLQGSPHPLTIPSGAASGDVLTSDASGNASWQSPAGTVTTLVAAPTGLAGADTAAINAAITAWLAAGRGILQFQEGTYVTNGGHLIGGGSPGAGVIQGTGWNTEIQLAAGANAFIFDFGSSGSPQYTPGIRMRDLYLNCNGGSQTGTSGGIYARGSVFGVFDHLWIDQPYTAGIWFYQDGLGNYGHHNRIIGSLFTNGYVSGSYGIGVKFDHADENSIDSSTFQDCGTSTYPSTQCYDTSGGRQSITNTAFVTTRTTSVAMFKTDSSPSACMIASSVFDSATSGNLLEINGPDCIIDGNQFLSFGNGAGANDAIHLSANHSQVTRNTFVSAGANGVAVAEDSGAYGNKVRDNKLTGTFASAPYQVKDMQLSLTDCGAVGDGSTDDTASVKAAFASVSTYGGTVLVPRGTFIMSSPAQVTAANVIVRGEGSQVSVLKMTASFGTSGTDRGMIEYLSGPSAWSGCGIFDVGFDTSACTDTTTNGPNAVYQNGGIPFTNFAAERLYFNLNSYGQGILLNQTGGSGGTSSGLTFRDIYAVNGAGTVSLYNNGVTAGSLCRDVLIDNITNLCTATSLQDDRICISGNNGSGTGVCEMRNISISNIYVEIASGATGAVNGVKLDCGAYGYIHEVSIRNVFYRGLSGITYNNPVLCNLGTSGTMQDILVDGVWAYNSAAIIVKLWRSDAAPHITIRNVHMYNLLDTRAIEVYTASSATGDETVLIENCSLHSGTSVSGNTPVGVMLTSGASGQGASGLVVLRGITLAGTFSTGLSDDLNESGSTQTSGYSNIKVSECNLSAATTPQVMVGANLTAGTATLNGTTAVTVSTAAVDSKSLVLLTVQPTTAPVGIPYVATLTAGSGFTLKSTSASDTAVVVAWQVIESI